MNPLARQHQSRFARLRPAATGGFTVAELMVALTVGSFLTAAFLAFLLTSARLTQGITKQSVMNQTGAHAIEMMVRRIRVANSLAVDAAGETLTLTFDDDPNTDGDGDYIDFNDIDRVEVFRFRYGPSRDAASGENFIDYWFDKNGVTNRVLLTSVRKLPGVPVFALTNEDATVMINLGVVDNYDRDLYQSIDLRFNASRRNHR